MATAVPAIQEKLSRGPGMIGVIGFGVILLVGLFIPPSIFSPIYLEFTPVPSLPTFCSELP